MAKIILHKYWEISNKLRTEGNKFYAEGDKLCAEGDKLCAEGYKLRAEGNKLYREVVKEYFGEKIRIHWNNGEVFSKIKRNPMPIREFYE